MTESEPGLYEHSGRLGASALLLPLGTAAIAVALSFAYAYVTVYSPVGGYITLLFVAGFGLANGWLISLLGYLTRCRSSMFLNGMGLFGGLLALYSSWAVFEYALLTRFDDQFDMGLIELMLSPRVLWDVAAAINVDGWYTLFGMAPSGTTLWVFWAIEAVAIVGVSTSLANGRLTDSVYCEDCEHWCTAGPDLARLAVPEHLQSLYELQPGEIDAILALEVPEPSDSTYLRVDSWWCENCSESRAVQLKTCTVTEDGDGKEKEETSPVTAVWWVTADELARFQQVGDLASAQQEAPKSEEAEE